VLCTSALLAGIIIYLGRFFALGIAASPTVLRTFGSSLASAQKRSTNAQKREKCY